MYIHNNITWLVCNIIMKIQKTHKSMLLIVKIRFYSLNNVQEFNNKDLLEFIEREYSGSAFPENSPFEFKDDYINLSNDGGFVKQPKCL